MSIRDEPLEDANFVGGLYSVPTRQEQIEFLLDMHFGYSNDDMDRLCGSAYLDLSRTVHKIETAPNAKRVAQKRLVDTLRALPSCASIRRELEFDGWHENLCKEICEVFAANGYEHFYVGQAQKWINMSLKYIFLFGEERLRGYSRFYGFAHVPIDNVVLDSSTFESVVERSQWKGKTWSRVKDYSEYFRFQSEFRKAFPGSAPLAVEFWEWSRSQRTTGEQSSSRCSSKN